MKPVMSASERAAMAKAATSEKVHMKADARSKMASPLDKKSTPRPSRKDVWSKTGAGSKC
jgi:hypothetical protein